jgi:hypothetical protein
MGTSERYTHTALCPCKNGSLVRKIDSPDYCFGQASSHSTEIRCHVCAKEWVFRGKYRMIHFDYLTSPLVIVVCDLYQARRSLVNKINAIKTDELKNKFVTLGFRYKKEEHRYVVEQKLFEGSYSRYLSTGLAAAAPRLDTDSIPACASLNKQLENIEGALIYSNRARDKWFQDNRAALEFIPDWRWV